jgi:ATP-dependent Clp protease protease subunit
MPLATARAMSRNCPSARHEAVQSQERFFIMETDDDTLPAATAEPRNSYLEEKAFKSRTLLIFGSITDAVAADVTRRLIALDADSPEKPIDILVSSPGGHLESGDAIHDIVRFISAPVNMIGTGWVGSAATHLYLAVPRERRVCLPNTRFLIHQPSGGAGGQATDIAIQAQEIIKARHRIAHEIARETGKPIDVVLADIERDRWLSAAEAVEYGLVSRIIQRKTELHA